MWKKIEQKFCLYISTDYVRMTKFRCKSIFVVLLVKKTKKSSRANLYFIIKICLFCLAHGKSQIFVKQLVACIDCEDVHAKFLFNFFDNSKYV
jgi:hypothetical protein